MARYNRRNQFLCCRQSPRFLSILKRCPQNFSIKTRYVDVCDRLLLVDIDYRVTNGGEHRLSFIDSRLYRCLALMELIDTLRIYIDS